MGFDPQTKHKPLVNVHKTDTKNNLLVTLGVIVFFVIATIALIYYVNRPAETRNEVHQEMQAEP